MMKYFNLKKLLKHKDVNIYITPFFDFKRQQMQFYYKRFIELEEVLQHMDSFLNSSEYEKIYKLAFSYLDKYIELYRKGYSDFKYIKDK